MPLYEYKCGKCGKVAEFLVRNSREEAELACPECGGTELEKLLSAPAVMVKEGAGGATRCDRRTPCCGRDTPCNAPPCTERGN